MLSYRIPLYFIASFLLLTAAPDRSAQSTARHDKAKRELKDLYARWEEALSVSRA